MHQNTYIPSRAHTYAGGDGGKSHSADVNKTGLGSSAALTTSVVAALLAHANIVSLPQHDGACVCVKISCLREHLLENIVFARAFG